MPVLPFSSALKRILRHRLASFGAYEHIGYAYVSKQLLTDPHRAVRIANPLSREQEFLRTSLLPGLYITAQANAKRFDRYCLFEFGKEYARIGGTYRESDTLGIVWRGPDAVRHVRGMLVSALKEGFRTAPVFTPDGEHRLTISLGEKALGSISLPTSREMELWNLSDDLAGATIHLDALASQYAGVQNGAKYQQIPSFPAVKRDLAFWLPKGVSYGTIEHVLESFDPLLVATEVFDVYTKGDRRSIALHLTFRAHNRTLTAEDADAVLERLKRSLTRMHGVTLRS